MSLPSRPVFRGLSAVLLVVGLGACGADEEPNAFDEAANETGLNNALAAVPEEARLSEGGPRVAAGASTEVWSVTNAWADTDTPAARASGVAWSASSGLSWEQKFERWIGAFRRVARTDGSGSTVQMPTPFGDRTLNAPTLECAEVAMFLRVTFAAWYHLPFYLQGWDSTGRQVLYAGHFGFVNRSGQTIARFPQFRTAYRDNERAWRPGMAWPTDSALRRYHLGSDDGVPWITTTDGSTAGAGAFFDEAHLNKRVGYFSRLLLLYFGSINLADPMNSIHVRPESIAAGDTLLERWQRQGIGHTIPVVRVTEPTPGRFAVDVISGSMPRRQPVWEDAARARHYFTIDYTGGPGNASDGTPYARLGGGLRRWRTAVLRSGQWFNEVLPADQAARIPDDDYAAISARTARFGEILVVPSPEERRNAAVANLNAAREHLRRYPASCSARTRREDSFEELYRVESETRNRSRAQVDADNRTLEDSVLAELAYEQSRTCCWNSSNAAMFEIVMNFATAEQTAARGRGMCQQPTVFRANGVAAGNDGYGVWRAHAMTLGRAADWRGWSEDEPCPGRTLPADPTVGREPAFCTTAAR